jgi:eukaryotic-like serine/threonine-protein kinase
MSSSRVLTANVRRADAPTLATGSEGASVQGVALRAPNGWSVSSPAFALPERPLVLDRYRPLRPLGSGGSGSVWLARDEETGLDVALKIVPREGKSALRAEREAEAAARLRHRRCLRAYGFGGDGRHVYIAYEYVAGETMREALRAGRLRDREAVEAAAQVLDGLAHAHARGIVHRDVKPSNVLLAEGDGVSVRLLDFGLAQFDEADTLTAMGDVPGTLAYISPERLAGAEATPASDIWGVGVMLWEALSGGHPFWGVPIGQMTATIQAGAAPLRHHRPDLPDRLLAAVDRALHIDPAKRPAAAKLAAELRECLRPRRRTKPPRGRALALPREVPLGRLAGAGLAAVAAVGGAALLPFYPPGLIVALGVLAGVLSLVAPRAGLAVALLAPVFPFGNLALGAALAYAAVAVVLLAAGWRDPRAGLVFVSGPLLAPLGLLALVPLAVQPARGAVRHALHAALAVLAAALVAGLRGVAPPLGAEPEHDLGLATSESPGAVLQALAQALADRPSLLVGAAVLATAAVALPYARARGLWGIAGLGAALIVGLALGAPAAPLLPIVAGSWLLCGALTGLALRTGR